MRQVSIGGALGALALMVGLQSGVATGQGVQRTDPQASSPAGVIYQIPLDSGRRDAAPVLPVGSHHGGSGGTGAAAGGGTGGGGGAGGDGSSGSASGASGPSDAPGANAGASGSDTESPSAAGRASAEESASAAAGGGSPTDPSSIHSENGFGSSSQVPGVSPAALQTGAGVAAAHAAGSTLPSYLLMALIVLAAIAVGLVASRLSREGPAGEGRPPSGI